ncbi:MAG: recombination protein F [Firmicutes bacterium ADurb.Bin506]|nr:MAG: recombination protein F [Firmicutes bacterium ADurb.Bin506]
MKWRVLWVEAEDFLCFKKVRLELTGRPNLVLIVGNRGPGRSNGSGKSALLEAITYALYGRTVRKLPAGGEIRRGAKACVVRECVRFENGKEIVVERGRSSSGPFCRVSGLDSRALASGVQPVLDAMLGDYTLFTSTAMFTGDAASFCRKTDSARKELLEQMLGAGNYESASEQAGVELAAANSAVQEETTNLAVQTRLIEDLADQRATLALEALASRARLLAVYKQKVAEAKDCSTAAHDAAAAVAEWIRVAAVEQAKAADDREAAEAAQEAVQEKLDALTGEAATVAATLSGISAKIRDLTGQIADVESGKHAEICPTCGQRWPQDGDPDEVAKIVKAHNAAVFKLRREAEPLRAREAEIDAELVDLRRDRQLAINAAKAAVAQLDQGKLRTLLAEAAEAEVRLEEAHAAVEAASARIVDEPEVDPKLADLDRRLEAARADSRQAKDRLGVQQGLASRMAFWRKGFSRTGLPSYLMDDSIPGMNAVVAEVAAALTDGELAVSFDPGAAKGSGSVFAVVVDYASGGSGFDAASKGERTRVDVSVLFALRDVAERAGGAECEQMFLDEVMDGADPHFTQCFIRLLRTRYRGRQVVMISHDPGVASLVDQTITVRKKGADAVLM